MTKPVTERSIENISRIVVKIPVFVPIREHRYRLKTNSFSFRFQNNICTLPGALIGVAGALEINSNASGTNLRKRETKFCKSIAMLNFYDKSKDMKFGPLHDLLKIHKQNHNC